MNNKDTKAMNIYQRVNAVREALAYIQKDKTVSAGAGGNYKAVTHDAVTGMIRPHLVKHGIVIVPTMLECEFHTKEEGAKQRLYEACYVIDFVNADAPEERISVRIGAHALDNGDKAPGKALSYATKYAILKLFSLETGEDDESRYQREEFDVLPFVEQMEACNSIEELQAAYTDAYKAVVSSGDKQATKTLIAAKDNAKRRISASKAAA